MNPYEEHLRHLSRLALSPGWWQFAKQQAKELEPLFQGITKDVAATVKAAGYRPPAEEMSEWWR